MAAEYFEVRVEGRFVASHVVGAEGDIVARHEHLWKVAVRAGSTQLDAIAIVVDFRRLRADLEEALAVLAGCRLEEIPGLAAAPADEAAVGRWLLRRLRRVPEGVAYRVVAVEVECDEGIRWVIGEEGAAAHAPV